MNDEELRKFKEMLHDSVEQTCSKWQALHQAENDKKQGMISNFKKAMWR
jgi:hypothetical protein